MKKGVKSFLCNLSIRKHFFAVSLHVSVIFKMQCTQVSLILLLIETVVRVRKRQNPRFISFNSQDDPGRRHRGVKSQSHVYYRTWSETHESQLPYFTVPSLLWGMRHEPWPNPILPSLTQLFFLHTLINHLSHLLESFISCSLIWASKEFSSLLPTCLLNLPPPVWPCLSSFSLGPLFLIYP